VSGYQLCFSNRDIFTPGDEVDTLVAMNPAALKTNIADLKRGGTLIVNEDAFDKSGLQKALYEANPLAFVVEQAGGRASTGTSRIMEVEAKKLHQRVPLIIGSRQDVETAEAFIQGKA
jgi:fructose-1,6-bisphosphatase